MFVNNEIGVIQDIRRHRRDLPRKGRDFPCGRRAGHRPVEIDLKHAAGRPDEPDLAQDLRPQGHWCLYVRRKPRVRLEAQMHGGGHERGMRSGTLPTHQIVGMGEAFRIARRDGTWRTMPHPRAATALLAG
jgi:cysteine desulfurase